jgi:hypothetical protein
LEWLLQAGNYSLPANAGLILESRVRCTPLIGWVVSKYRFVASAVANMQNVHPAGFLGHIIEDAV